MSDEVRQFRAQLTGYFPPPSKGYASPEEAKLEGGPLDRLGNPLFTLQRYLAGNAPYVSVAMDPTAFRYGQQLRIASLELMHRRTIRLLVVDTGDDFMGMGRGRIDICTADRPASRDPRVNGEYWVQIIEPPGSGEIM